MQGWGQIKYANDRNENDYYTGQMSEGKRDGKGRMHYGKTKELYEVRVLSVTSGHVG